MITQEQGEHEFRQDWVDKWLDGETRTDRFVETVNANRLEQYRRFKENEHKTVLHKLRDIEAGQ